jgi:NAD(P) transhydrogenase subunit alpha
MILGVPSETAADETRVALIPPVADTFVDEGHEVLVESGAGDGADWTDEQYRDVGCEVLDDRSAVFDRADVLLHVRGLAAHDDGSPDPYSEEQTVIGLLGPWEIDDETVQALADKGVNAIALELIPRISRAQSMDPVSTMDSLSGYRAVTLAANSLPKMMPMEMTAAGTVKPAEVFVLGAGVAGLKAISTAERLGAATTANDVRPEVAEEVESLGADFVAVGGETDDMSDEEGYATEQDKSFEEQQREMLFDVVPDADIVITTAAIPGRPAPQPITEEIIAEMEPGSVVVDLAAPSGGNCEPSVAGEVVEFEGVEIHGPENLPATIAHTASQLYANNLSKLLNLITSDGELALDLEDEIVDSTLLTYDGTVRNPHRDDEEESDDESEDDTTDEASSTDESSGDESSDDQEAAEAEGEDDD